MRGLDGYTFCSGIICDELNGFDYVAIPIEDATDIMEIGYITRKNTIISDVGKKYIEKLKSYLGIVWEMAVSEWMQKEFCVQSDFAEKAYTYNCSVILIIYYPLSLKHIRQIGIVVL